MGNIWGFLLQTLSVSLVAALLLVVKRLLLDKLSPRWQYGVWSLLALRILIPAGVERNVFLPLPLWMETWKGMVEKGLESVYSAVYTPISMRHVLPVFRGAPSSVTDWLLVAYSAGVAVCLLWYLVSYVRLRRLLKRGLPANEAVERELWAVCEDYGLNPCRVVMVEGLPSAFVCGVLHPVLAVPAGEVPDRKILLHELLHLKYRDALQSVGWCVLRALHWCNPFLWYVFRRIGNDMESLCDQRVLERLEGEERRAYGSILLDMANERYARAPGTSSISNGGRNIARRIEAIVRFKKYPQGMALVSVCIAAVLLGPTLFGTAAAYHGGYFRPAWADELDASMAMARIHRCTTLAGALDTYAKGLMLDNGIYIATASPLSEHPRLEAEMRYNVESEGWVAFHLDPGTELQVVDSRGGYQIYNLVEQDDGTFRAILALPTNGFRDEKGEIIYDEEGEMWYDGCVTIPVTVWQEDGWVVEESGPRRTFREGMFNLGDQEGVIPWLRELRAEGRTGTVTVRNKTEYVIKNEVKSTTWSFFGGTSFDFSAKVDAEFAYAWILGETEYNCMNNATGEMPSVSAGIALAALESRDEVVEFPDKDVNGNGSWHSNAGFEGAYHDIDGASWNGTVTSGGGSTFAVEDGYKVPLPSFYLARISWDGKVVEELRLEGGDQP